MHTDLVQPHRIKTDLPASAVDISMENGSGPVSFADHPAFAATSEFSTLGEEAKAALVRASRRRLYSPNGFVYLQDDDAEHLYFVRSGHVRLSYLMEDGSAVLFGILSSGETFGELGVFENGTYCDMATAVGTVSVVSIPARTFRTLAERYPELNVALGRVVARRYRSYVALTRSLGLKTLPARLSQALLRLADGLRTTTDFGGRTVPFIGSFVTQADLGLVARGARGNVNRALKTWERCGWIAIEDRRILILNRARLEALSIEEGI
jgi:CRP/FNR family transcriptional regulator, cyclic AMP receptor protein